MPRRVDNFGQDILSLLRKVEPEMLLWRELKDRLSPLHSSRYKDEKVYGVALTNKLTRLQAKGHIKKVGDYYGTLYSRFPKDISKYDQYVDELKKIGETIFTVSPDYGWHKLTIFVATLPKPLKDKIYSTVLPIAESNSHGDRMALKIAIDEISTILFEHFT